MLLAANGAFNALGAALLLAIPDRLTYGLRLGPSASFLWHLLAAASLAFAVLSLGSLRLADVLALQVVVITLLVFHAASALVSVWAALTGFPSLVWLNTLVHVIFVVLFAVAAVNLQRQSP